MIPVAWLASPLIRKIGIYAIIALVVFWIGRQWLNKHDNQVAQETRQEVTEEQRIKTEEIIKSEREAIAKEKDALVSQIEKLNTDLDKVYRSLDNALKVAQKAQEQNASVVIGIPDHKLNGSIRTVLRRGQLPPNPNGTAGSPSPTP